MRSLSMPTFAAALALTGCGGGEATGALTLRISGEDAAKRGYPVVVAGEEIAFVDGWKVRFHKLIASVGEVELRGHDGEVALAETTTYVAELTTGDPVLERYEGLPARRWERFSFSVLAPTNESVNVNDVDPEALERMIEHRYNYWIEGEAEKDGATLTFAWGLENPTRNASCTNGLDGTEGVVIRRNATTEAELTVHIDHLFWDTLGSEQLRLRFDAIAGAADEAGHIDTDALASQRLSDLRDREGNPLTDSSGARVIYNPESVPLPDHNLKEFILAAAASQVHYNGAGLCSVTRL